MDLYEYQARDLFEAHGVPVLAGIVAYTREIGPRNATELIVAAPAGSAVMVTDSGRTMARPAPATEPSRAGTEVPSRWAWPPETSAGTLLFSPTNSATNGVAGFA